MTSKKTLVPLWIFASFTVHEYCSLKMMFGPKKSFNKVSKFQKHFFLFSLPPKTERNIFFFISAHNFACFFGGNENKKICFWNLLTFRWFLVNEMNIRSIFKTRFFVLLNNLIDFLHREVWNAGHRHYKQVLLYCFFSIKW